MSAIANLFKSTEEQEPIVTNFKGELPDWLNGTLISVGPGLFDLTKDFSLNHWCDGFGIVCKYDIKDGKLEFSKKFVQSDAYKKAKANGKPVYTEFGTKAYSDSSKNMFQKLLSNVLPELTDNVANNIHQLGKTIYLATETNFRRTLDLKTLETPKKIDLTNIARVNMTCSHLYIDDDNTAFTMGTGITTGIRTHIFKISNQDDSEPGQEYNKLSSLAVIPNRYSTQVTYSHSFGISKNWIIFIEQPLFMAATKLITATMKGKCLIDCMEWNPEEPNRFILVNKTSGNVCNVTYEATTPFFFFHHINAYELNGELIVDILAHDSNEVIDKMHLKHLREGNYCLKDKSAGRRYVLPLIDNIKDTPEGENLVKCEYSRGATAIREGKVIKLTKALLTEPAYELPAVNKKYFGKPYKYFYAAGLYDDSKYKNSLVKVNTDTGEVIIWKESNTSFPGEPTFVPSPNSNNEDDGIILTAVTEIVEGKPGYLVVLNAKDLKEIARAVIDSHVPCVLHGIFVQS